MNHELLSTREVALALGVSESSTRRWCDQGKLRSVRTAGGHRKVAIDAILQFVRETGHPIEQADILGIAHGLRPDDFPSALPEFVEALRNDEAALCHSFLTSAYSEGKSLLDIFDQLIGPAMVKIGSLWESGEIGVDQERRSCQIVLKGLSQLENFLPAAEANAPTALGGTPEGDFSQIGTKMAELVLRSNGWDACQIGAGMPLESLASACRRKSPDLLWLSVIHLRDPDYFVQQYRQHLEPLIATGLTVVVGGRDVTEALLRQIRYAFHGQSMQQFEAFCQGAPRRNLLAPATEIGLGCQTVSVSVG